MADQTKTCTVCKEPFVITASWQTICPPCWAVILERRAARDQARREAIGQVRIPHSAAKGETTPDRNAALQARIGVLEERIRVLLTELHRHSNAPTSQSNIRRPRHLSGRRMPGITLQRFSNPDFAEKEIPMPDTPADNLTPLVLARLTFDDHRRSCPSCLEGQACYPSSVLWGAVVDALTDRGQPIPRAAEPLPGPDTRHNPGEGRKSPPRGLPVGSEPTATEEIQP